MCACSYLLGPRPLLFGCREAERLVHGCRGQLVTGMIIRLSSLSRQFPKVLQHRQLRWAKEIVSEENVAVPRIGIMFWHGSPTLPASCCTGASRRLPENMLIHWARCTAYHTLSATLCVECSVLHCPGSARGVGRVSGTGLCQSWARAGHELDNSTVSDSDLSI